jgi:predicted small integral membrane protein
VAFSPNTYSFLSVQATIVGPGGAISIGSSAGVTEEGISVEPKEEKNTMQIGADGQIMHALHAGSPGRATIRLLKTSPTNALLAAMYNFQRLSPANWGNNTVVVSDTNRGDFISLTTAAFVKQPNLSYDKGGRMNEWVFEGQLSELLGAGVPNVNSPTGV